MRPPRVAGAITGISCTQAVGRSWVIMTSWQVSKSLMPAIDSGLLLNVYHSSLRFHGFGVAAAVKIGCDVLLYQIAVPDVPAVLCWSKLEPTKLTYQAQLPPW